MQAAGGAKNHLIIMPDADLNQAVKAIQASAFGCAGERCMAGSLAVPVGGIADPLVDGLVNIGKSMKVGPTDDGGNVDMGPVISQQHRDKVASYLDVAAKEGASVALDGRKAEMPAEGFSIGTQRRRSGSARHATGEGRDFWPGAFGDASEDAGGGAGDGRDCEYGNGACIFTSSGYAARQFKRHFNAGMIGINVGVPAPMAWFPFTGWNKSFFGDLHIQGMEGIQFYTQQKMTLTRWFESAKGGYGGSGLEDEAVTRSTNQRVLREPRTTKNVHM